MPGSREEATWYRLSQDEALTEIGSRREGLSDREAESRLQEYGPNTIRTEEGISPWKVLLDQFASPLIYVLFGALAVTLAIQHYTDAIVIGAVLVINATIGFFQEYRAEKAVQSLMKMVSPKARVRRDGNDRQIDGDRIVPGDVALLSEGDMVPADIRLIRSSSLQINEAALTGESVPSSKTSEPMGDAGEHLPPSDQENMAFMGTAVTAGRGEGVVIATGRRTQLGEIAEDVRGVGEITTPLQRRMERLSKWIAAIILGVAAVAFGVGLLMGRDMTEMFLLAVALAVSAIPEGLPVVVTVALAIGVRRMARRRAVIRHLPAVETLGSTMTIVSDKTGTLTQNRMTVKAILAGDARHEVTGESLSPEGQITRDGEHVEIDEDRPLYYALLAGLLNNSARLDGGDEQGDDQKTAGRQDGRQRDEQRRDEDPRTAGSAAFRPQGDPMEVALLISATKAGLSRDELQASYPPIDEVPFQTERRFSATVHDVPQGQEGPLVLIKGAPETVLDMCQRKLTNEGQSADLDRDEILRRNDELAADGLRVLAMAIGRGSQARQSIQGETPEGMTFVGMQGLLDPPRPEAIRAVDQCHAAGIRVIMVTGDHARTAAAIAQQVHLDRPIRHRETQHGQRNGANGTQAKSQDLPEVHTGREIAEASDGDLDEMLRRTNVFARVMPEQKLRIVERLKAQNQVVAVTGDGVNDAPALKSAHLGAAMGLTGTDVAKEASDMVITDDNFASVYSAVEEGRAAFRNIRMATFFLLSTGAAEVTIILTALGFRWPLPMLPAQILWVNVVTNGIADVALAFEPGERALVERPPRPLDEGVLDRTLIERLAFIGIWLAVGTLAVFAWSYLYRGDDVALARTAAVTTLVLFQVVHVFNCRSEDVSIFKKNLFSNKVLFGGVLASLGVHIAAMYLGPLQTLLDLQPLSWELWAASIAAGATAVVANELHKWLRPSRA